MVVFLEELNVCTFLRAAFIDPRDNELITIAQLTLIKKRLVGHSYSPELQRWRTSRDTLTKISEPLSVSDTPRATRWRHQNVQSSLATVCRSRDAHAGLVRVSETLSGFDATPAAADECLVAALKDRHMLAIFKVAGAAGIGGG
jgi:hypothetical protein